MALYYYDFLLVVVEPKKKSERVNTYKYNIVFK